MPRMSYTHKLPGVVRTGLQHPARSPADSQAMYNHSVNWCNCESRSRVRYVRVPWPSIGVPKFFWSNPTACVSWTFTPCRLDPSAPMSASYRGLQSVGPRLTMLHRIKSAASSVGSFSLTKQPHPLTCPISSNLLRKLPLSTQDV